MNTKKFLPVILALVLLLSACQRNVTRNGDGSVDVETTITQQELQDAINASIADPLIKDLTVSLQSGYALVSGTREPLDDGTRNMVDSLNDPTKTDSLSFRLDLGMSNGQLTATISDAQFDGFTVEQNRISNWNTTIANRITRLAQKSPNTTLKSVIVTTSAITMTWTTTN